MNPLREFRRTSRSVNLSLSLAELSRLDAFREENGFVTRQDAIRHILRERLRQ